MMCHPDYICRRPHFGGQKLYYHHHDPMTLLGAYGFSTVHCHLTLVLAIGFIAGPSHSDGIISFNVERLQVVVGPSFSCGVHSNATFKISFEGFVLNSMILKEQIIRRQRQARHEIN